jgi:cyclophilin family peptidyl-prolyl cis-trans isomerase
MKIRFFSKLVCLILCASFAFCSMASAKALKQMFSRKQDSTLQVEGRLLLPSITVGPFDLHRRYRSMEGPYVDTEIVIGDAMERQEKNLPEEMVRFVENGGQASMTAQALSASTTAMGSAANEPRQLYWLKGVRIDLLDENNRLLPTAEFFCHLNIDVDTGFRNREFPEGERCMSARLFTLTQGQTEILFPKGYGVPVASDEKLRCIFQAANRTTDEHRRIKQRLTLYLIPDKQLLEPITALNWYTPFMAVVVDKNSEDALAKEAIDCSLCLPTSKGVTAPNAVNDAVENDSFGRKVSGHWVIPPGKTSWTGTIRDYKFQDKPRIAHLIWSHVHPLCTEFSLVNLDANGQANNLYTATCRSRTSPGVQLEHIDLFSSSQGIRLAANRPYELEIKYDNPTKAGLDSMATMGIFCEDNEFARPSWAISSADSIRTCGVKGSCSVADHQAASQAGDSNMPLFDPARDGPMLTGSARVKVQTTAGNLFLVLRPEWAPLAATQMRKLFQNGCFNGTAFYRLDDYLVQLGTADSKAPGYAPISQAAQALLRRIPVELTAENDHVITHRPGVLSMAREKSDPAGNVSSFSIMLREWPTLDGDYTIFGELADDAETKATVEALKSAWQKNNHAVVLGSELVETQPLSISVNPSH